MDRTEEQREADLQAKGLNDYRLNPVLIESLIVKEDYWRVPDTFTIVAALTLKNGFTVVGKSAPASPCNFDEAEGRKIARQRAKEEIWPLEGYLLKQRLTEESSALETYGYTKN